MRRSQLIVAQRDPVTIFWATTVATAFCVGVSVALSGATVTGSDLGPVNIARLLVLVIVVAPLWYRMNRDITAYLRVRGAQRAGRPVLSLLAMAFGWLGSWASGPDRVLALIATTWVLVSVYNTGKRVRHVEWIAGQQPGNLVPSPLLLAGFAVFPFVLTHIQRTLNDVWRRAGDVLD